MKRTIYLCLSIAAILYSCSKKKNELPTSKPVSISGTYYPTVVIGSQTWTTVNYNGPGGINYNNSAVNEPIYGKYYNYLQVKAITPPTGWRVPTKEDFIKLIVSQGIVSLNGIYIEPNVLGFNLTAKTTWTSTPGNNMSGFNAVAAGETRVYGGVGYKGEGCYFATTTKAYGIDSNLIIAIDVIDLPPTEVNFNFISALDANGENYFSVRFCKDN